MAKCLWVKCGIEFVPKIPKQKFHSQKCKDDYHNYEKMHGMRVPECFRQAIEELATHQEKTLQEMVAEVVSVGLRWEEQGKPLTDEQIFGESEEHV